jgi:hypothetical protein
VGRQTRDVVGLGGRDLGRVGPVLHDGVEQVERPGGGQVAGAELDVGDAAVEGGLPVEVVGGDHGEDRLEGRVGADGGSGVELVDAEVRQADQADLAVGGGEPGGPVHQGYAVMGLHRVEEAEGPAGAARTPDVGHGVDVAPFHQIGVGSAPGRREEAASRLAVGRLGEDDREGPRSRRPRAELGGEVDVGPQHRAVGHLDGNVQGGADAVAGRSRGPAATGRSRERDDRTDHHGQQGHEHGTADESGPIGRRHRTSLTHTIVR